MLLTASALCLGSPSPQTPCAKTHSDPPGLRRHCPPDFIPSLSWNPLAGYRPVSPRLLSAHLQLPGPGSTSLCYSLLSPLRAFFYAGLVEQPASFKHVTESYPSASAALFSCSRSLTAYLLSLRTRGSPRHLPHQHPEDWQVCQRRSTHACWMPCPCGFAGALGF